ncbi:MAG: NahK/ErcS family hybrid sensor histidine kinase/response regulator [Pontibacterium sp.]
MLSGWTIILISLAYVGLLFGIAYFGDKTSAAKRWIGQPFIYSASLAVYCSSWTFYGAVGRANASGWEFFATYLGPILVFGFGWRVIEKITLISKQQNITSISDFISSRYGKSQALAVLVTVIAVCGTVPYIAMQLKAVAISYSAVTDSNDALLGTGSDTALFVALLMAIFAVLFGTRHIDATEHHEGLVLAVAFESVVKLTAFIAVGLFVCFQLFDGVEGTLIATVKHLESSQRFGSILSDSFLVETVLACAAIICLPRQFHVTIVEAHDAKSIRTARWVFPVYMALMALFVLPIATGGHYFLGQDAVNPDTYVLMLPLSQGADSLAIFAFIGGLSAATSMVIVASITLATMVCNDIVMPLLLRISWLNLAATKDLGALLLKVRRVTIACLMILAYFYYRIAGEHGALASFGLLAFVAALQFLPAILAGIYWKKVSRHGVLVGMAAGFIIWLYTLIFPTLVDVDLLPTSLLASLSINYPWLTPTALFNISGLDPLTHGVLWSLSANTLCCLLFSRYASHRVVDRIQASAFVDVYDKNLAVADNHIGNVTAGDLHALAERFLGQARTQHAFSGFAIQNGDDEPPLSGDKATPEMVQFTERLLAGVIGASSARIILASTLRGKEMQIGDVVTIIDEASQALRFNRSLLQSTIENISLGISVVDQQMRLVAWNKPYTEMFNYPDGLICVGRPITEIFRYNALNGEYGPGNIDEQVQKRLAILRSSEPHSYERFRPDGTVVDVRGSPMPDGGYVNTYMDVTQYKQIEEALRESEQNIRIYTDNVPVLIAYLDPEQRYLFVNKAYADTFGIDRHHVSGIPCYKIMPADEYAFRAPFIRNALEGKRQRFEANIVSPSGETRYAEVTYIPHIGDYGDVLGYFSLYQDITERRKAEIALQETNENLEMRVNERTRALSVVNKELRKENTIRALIEDELRQAKSDAEAANLGKTRFLAAASHDLLQPLNAARLFSSALAQQSHSDETRQLVDNLDGSLKAAEELITTILDISKLDAGSLEPTLSHFAMDDLLTNLKAEFTALAAEKGLRFRCAPCNLIVHTDQQLLRRILQNFLSNAIRYTQDGGVLLGCRRRGDYLKLEVWDTGVGITEDKQQEVFEEFRRIDNPKHSQVQGLGLGLAITERIAKMLDHPIGLRSWPSKGTVFSVLVPIGDSSLAQTPKPEKRGWIRSKGLDGVRVLIIDNEPKILEGMSALLKGWSCEVYTALSPQAAQEIVQGGTQPDIILADYHLSENETGVMAVKQIDPWLLPNTPVIVITADRTDEVKQEVADLGYQLLNKPVRPAGLRAMINKVVATARAAAK